MNNRKEGVRFPLSFYRMTEWLTNEVLGALVRSMFNYIINGTTDVAFTMDMREKPMIPAALMVTTYVDPDGNETLLEDTVSREEGE